MTDPIDAPMPSPLECLERLRLGNVRFVSGPIDRTLLGWRPGLVEGQRPFAVILGCSDSRAPAELVFDQGLGELFVIRVAGNIVAPSGIGSVEFAVSKFGTPLVVVMGHTHCGAVAATVQGLLEGDTEASKPMRSITDRIRPHVLPLVQLAREGRLDTPALLRQAGRANTLACTDAVRHGSAVLEELIGAGKVLCVGAEYELETGHVDFFDTPAS